MKKTILHLSTTVLFIWLAHSCTPFLDVKSDEKLAVPTTLEDFEALLNGPDLILEPAEGEVMTTDFYLSDDDFEGMYCQLNTDLYRWIDNPFIEMCDGKNGWELSYQNIYRSNVVLDGLQKYEQDKGENEHSRNVKGHAYFVRATNHLGVVQLWAKAYDRTTSNSDLGIPLKLTADFNKRSTRASLQETMEQIEDDLLKAADLLPERQRSVRLPSKISAWAYLSRFYLYLSDFKKAKHFAELCIDSGLELIDFNTLSFTGAFPFNMDTNTEILYARVLTTAYESLGINLRRVDMDLYDSYAEEDLRKTIYFSINADGSIRFRGSYSGGGGGLFSGPALNEIYLIAAECHARENNFEKAKEYLYRLLRNRMAEGYVYEDLQDSGILEEVLKERRKELLLRGIRFGDVKRLNKTGASLTLKRTIGKEEYNLPPNSPNAVLLIPQNVVEISGMMQNPR